MNWYGHLPKGDNRYVCLPDGRIKIHSVPVLVNVSTGQLDYTISDSVRLLTQYIVVGLWVNGPGTTQQKITETKSVVSRAVFDSAQLDLRDNTNVLLEKMPLRYVEHVNLQGKPFYINGSFINISESTLYVQDNAGIGANEAIQFHMDYIIPRKAHIQQMLNNNK